MISKQRAGWGRSEHWQPMVALLRVARAIAYALNSAFLLLSVALIAFVCFAAISAPEPDISPEPVNSYPQYTITLLLILSYSICMFTLTFLGLCSLCVTSSFLMSVHILGQIAMVSAQLIAIAFTITVRKRLHYKLEQTWRGRANCAEGDQCQPIQRFLHSEALLILILCIFLALQIILLIASSTLCEQRSYEERTKLQHQKNEEDDD
uniref:MARVEL domain-containing protein n=1 Tax=Heterorhabditis bacteriophora TaxID=37862 RepID=A0A1I7WCS8_HETBA